MDKIKFTTNVKIIKNGEIVKNVTNTIVNAGLAALSGLLLLDIGGTAFDYLAIGTGSSAVTAADTTLGTESYRVAGTGTQQTSSVANDTARLTGSFSITGTHAITEAGILNAASTGTLLNRTVFSAVNVNSGDTLEIQWT